jgi:hypothetical protein
MELDPMELALIIVAAVSVLGVAFGLAWIDASPRRQGRQG